MPTMRQVISATLLLALLGSHEATAEVPSYDRVRVLESPRLIDDVELTDQDGEPFRISELHDRIALVFFGFTNCPDVCPTTMELFRQFQGFEGVDPSRLAFVLISVDGERDTPTVMKAYLARFSSEFIGLTGDPAVVKALAEQFSAAFFKRGAAEHGHYTIGHSPQAFVLDASGRLRAELYAPSLEAMLGVTGALLAE